MFENQTYSNLTAARVFLVSCLLFAISVSGCSPASMPTPTPMVLLALPTVFIQKPETGSSTLAPDLTEVLRASTMEPPTAFISSTLKPATPSQTPTPLDSPRMYDFEACLQPCNGANAQRSFPVRTEKIYIRWSFANLPLKGNYVRVWTQAGREWGRHKCIWPKATSGVEEITLTEPDGLHSGEWMINVHINGELLLTESIFIEGDWTFWEPAGTFNSCYGKR